MSKSILLIKNRSDIGAGTRGADMGIDAIEIAAINQGNDFFHRFPHEDIPTHNESVYNMVHSTFAKRIGKVFEQCNRVAESLERNLRLGHFPIVLAGDHSSALGTISGIKAAHPDKTLGVIWIDAHADLHSPYTSPSGNVHGMPLAAALGLDNQESRINEVYDLTAQYWDSLKNVGTPGAKMKPEHLIFFGVRDTEAPEESLMESQQIRNYRVDEVRYRGLETCLEEAKAQLADCDMLYLSFDVDSLDCDLISRGTGTPVPKGFDQHEVIRLIAGFLETGRVHCLEVVEVNPLLDTRGNRMAETAFEVLDAVVKRIPTLNTTAASY